MEESGTFKITGFTFLELLWAWAIYSDARWTIIKPQACVYIVSIYGNWDRMGKKDTENDNGRKSSEVRLT